jgi:hypothetical protein
VQQLADRAHVRLAHVARRERGRAEADAARRLRGRVARDRVLCTHASARRPWPHRERRTVDGDPDEVAQLLELRAGQLERAQVPEHEVVVRPVRLELVAVAHERLRERARVRDDLLRVRLPLGLRRLAQRDRDARDRLLMRSARI